MIQSLPSRGKLDVSGTTRIRDDHDDHDDHEENYFGVVFVMNFVIFVNKRRSLAI